MLYILILLYCICTVLGTDTRLLANLEWNFLLPFFWAPHHHFLLLTTASFYLSMFSQLFYLLHRYFITK